ncbi:hypothetical protein B9T31_04170 [Acinetobacter sp. ANC 4558]|uniref:hypothetical protein n=1 Tax=Acinetobacter sp. ANC 4558 TaxID=1977876 RepID=UPI000A33FDEF|nr:hypothetical protein [Acinetobacter sp. ANC 4558]OTG87700.1 hypothetical protein B9T31_04170 [Acinetobacter sp. ANC 4558]
MDRIYVEGELPVALKLIVGQTEHAIKKVMMRQMTAIEYVQSQAALEPDCYIGIADVAAMTKLIDEDNHEHIITYDMLGNSSRSNLDYLNKLKNQLEAKEKAES